MNDNNRQQMQDTTTIDADKVNWSAKDIGYRYFNNESWLVPSVCWSGVSKIQPNAFVVFLPREPLAPLVVVLSGCRNFEGSSLIFPRLPGLINCRNSVQRLTLRSRTCAVERVRCFSPSTYRRQENRDDPRSAASAPTVKRRKLFRKSQRFKRLTRVQRGRSFN